LNLREKSKSSLKNPSKDPSGALIRALTLLQSDSNPDKGLAEFIRRWPELSDETKRLILLLVREGGRK